MIRSAKREVKKKTQRTRGTKRSGGRDVRRTI